MAFGQTLTYRQNEEGINVMKIFKNRSESGVITVMISLMLVSILSIGSLILEAGRLQSARTQLGEANISASTSTLCSYNKELYDRFGIYAFEDSEKTKANFLEYLKYNSDLNANYLGNNMTRLYSVKDCTLNGYYNLTYPSALKRQIISNTKYYANTYDAILNNDTYSTILLDFVSKCAEVSTYYQSIDVNVSMTEGQRNALKAVESTLSTYYDYDESCAVTLDSDSVSKLPSKTGTVETKISADELKELQNGRTDAKKVLGGYSASIGTVDAGRTNSETTTGFDASNMNQVRSLLKAYANKTTNSIGGTKTVSLLAISKVSNALRALVSSSEAQSNFLLNNYIAFRFSNRTNTANGYVGPVRGTKSASSFSSACAEYIFKGASTEKENQQAAYWAVFCLRLIDNAYYLSKNGTGSKEARFTWAFYETLVDMAMLTESRTVVPMTKEALFLPMTSDSTISSSFTGLKTVGDAVNGVGSTTTVNVNSVNYKTARGTNYASYTDYISAALWLVPNSNKMLRIADVIQLEMRYRQSKTSGQTPTFLMSKQCTYCKATINATFNSILPVISLNGQGQMGGIVFKSTKYVGY